MDKHVVFLLGVEPLYQEDGKFRKFGEVFANNYWTYCQDHPTDLVNVIDAREYADKVKPITAIMTRLKEISRTNPIDLLIYSGHSSTNNLLVYYKYNADTPNRERFISGETKWDDVQFSGTAKIELHSCRAGGNYIEDPTSIAQQIANMSLVPTYAYICRTSQQKVGNKYYQKPEKPEYNLIAFKPMR